MAHPDPGLIRRPFWFLRHGRTDWNSLGSCAGQQDRPLDATGEAQAAAIAPIIASLGVTKIYHSTLRRAARTAAIIAGSGRYALVPERDLQEACLGVREGTTELDPDEDFISDWLDGMPIDGAETFTELQWRVVAAVNRCLTNADEPPPLLVAHWAVFHAIAAASGARGYNISNCEPCRFVPTESGWRIESLSGAG